MDSTLILAQAEKVIDQIVLERLRVHGFVRSGFLEFDRAVGGDCMQYVRVPVRGASNAVFFACHLVIEPEAVKRAFARLDCLSNLSCALFCPIQRLAGDD